MLSLHRLKPYRKYLALVFFLMGAALLLALMGEVGWENIFSYILRFRLRIFIVLFFPLSWYIIQTFAWWRILADDGVRVSFIHVFLAKIGGEAVNTITPVSFLGGDPYRVYVLQKKISTKHSTSSVVVDRTMYVLAVFLLLLTALLAAYFYLPMPPLWQIVFPVFTVAMFFAFVALVIFQKKGMFRFTSNVLKRLHIKRQKLLEIEHNIEDLDEQVSQFYRKHKLHFFEIMLLQYVGRFLGVVEIYLIVSLLGLDISFTACLFMASLTILINLIFVFIPGSLGVMEGGYGALFYLMKLNPVEGVAIQITRRLRTFFWIFLGLLVILFYKPRRGRA